MAEPVVVRPLMRFGVFELDVRAGELRKAGARIALQDQPLEILKALLERPGEIVTRDELRQRLWPADTFVDFEHGLNAAVKRLRDALGDSAEAPRYVETIPRRGYRFIAPVDRNGTATTVTVSACSPTWSVMSTPRVSPGLITIPRSSCLLKPWRWTTSVYVPEKIELKTYLPCASVLVLRSSRVPSFSSVNAAPATRPPVASLISPRSVAVPEICATAATDVTFARSTATHATGRTELRSEAGTSIANLAGRRVGPVVTVTLATAIPGSSGSMRLAKRKIKIAPVVIRQAVVAVAILLAAIE